MEGDIPALNHTKLCSGGHFTFSFESVRGAGVGISRPASREGCCCRPNNDFVCTVNLHCNRAGAVRFAVSLLASAKRAAGPVKTRLHGMRQREP